MLVERPGSHVLECGSGLSTLGLILMDDAARESEQATFGGGFEMRGADRPYAGFVPGGPGSAPSA